MFFLHGRVHIFTSTALSPFKTTTERNLWQLPNAPRHNTHQNTLLWERLCALMIQLLSLRVGFTSPELFVINMQFSDVQIIHPECIPVLGVLWTKECFSCGKFKFLHRANIKMCECGPWQKMFCCSLLSNMQYYIHTVHNTPLPEQHINTSVCLTVQSTHLYQIHYSGINDFATHYLPLSRIFLPVVFVFVSVKV